jgi:hypothetical protein
MQHSDEAKELLSDHWKEGIVVVQQMARLHHNLIWGKVRRGRGGKGLQIHVGQELDRLAGQKNNVLACETSFSLLWVLRSHSSVL